MDSDPATVTIAVGTEAGITVLPPAGLVTSEAGGGALFRVRLNREPTAVVTISFYSSDPGEGTVSPATLVFTPWDWSDFQTVTITGVDDDLRDGEVGYLIRFDPAVSADLDYRDMVATSVSVINLDDDITAIDPRTGRLAVNGDDEDGVQFGAGRRLVRLQAEFAGQGVDGGAAELQAAAHGPVGLGNDAGDLAAGGGRAAQERAGDLGSAEKDYSQFVSH